MAQSGFRLGLDRYPQGCFDAIDIEFLSSVVTFNYILWSLLLLIG